MSFGKVQPINVRVCKSRVFEEHVSQMWEEVKNKESISFHRAMRWTLSLLQIFLIFPVNGVAARSPKALSIKKTGVLYVSNTILLGISSIDLFLVLRLVLVLGIGIKSTSAFTFAIVTLCAGFAIRTLAMQWPRLMVFWKRHEDVFLHYPYHEPKYNLGTMLTSGSAFMLILVVAGHAFALGKSVSENKTNIEVCLINRTENVDFFEHMYHRERPQIFNLIRFQIWMLPFLEIYRFILSLYWTFIDIIIIHVSIGLTTRFLQLETRIIENKYNGSEEVWYDIRVHYGQLVDLVMAVDKSVSTLILISCANNMYFICYNIFKSFTLLPDLVSVIQFWYDLLLTIFKAAAVLLSASTINETATRLSNSVRQVPSHCWNIETERLVEQIESYQVALTGKHMFKLTRTLILAFSGTIVTLEIVLLDHTDKYEGNNLFKCNLSF